MKTIIFTLLLAIIGLCSVLPAETYVVSSQADIEAINNLENIEDLHIKIYLENNFQSKNLSLARLSNCQKLKSLTITKNLNVVSIVKDVPVLHVKALPDDLILSLPVLPSLEKFSIPNLELFLSQASIDAFFNHLAQIPSLKSLDLRGNYFLYADKNINSISALQNLEELSIADQLGNEDLSAKIKGLKDLPNLKSLDIHNVKYFYSKNPSNDLAFLLSLPLNHLNVSDCFQRKFDWTFPWKRIPVNLPTESNRDIRSLHLNGVDFQSLNFNTITPNLESLSIARTDLSRLSFFDLSASSQLKALNLSEAILSQENIEQMGMVTFFEMEMLDLSHTKVKSMHFDVFAPNLKVLNLAHSNVGNGDLGKISNLSELKELNLEQTNVSGSGIKKLVLLKNLKKLNLSGSKIRNENAGLLANLENLEKLNLSQCDLSLIDFHQLAELTQLKEIDLRGITNGNINAKLIDDLRQKLPNCKILF